MDYHDFEVEDFIQDEYFIQWVKTPDVETSTFWEQWLQQHPSKLATLEEAKLFILNLEFEKNKATDLQKKKVKDQIFDSLELSSRKSNSTQKPFYLKRSFQVAASLLLLVASIFLLNRSNNLNYQTAFSEIQNIELSDGSTIILNANSTLKASKNWKEKREVWLEGEAFFNIKKWNGKPFIVHTNALDVNVLGTQFNVKSRADDIDVVLSEGAVEIDIVEKEKFEIKPGQGAFYNKKINQYLIDPVDTDRHIAWIKRKLIFNGEPLFHLKEIIKEEYGFDVIADQNILMENKLEGTIDNANLETLITTIETIFKFQVKKEGNKLIITK